MNKKDFYSENGYLIVESLIPEDLIEEYKKYWIEHHAPNFDGTIISIENISGWQATNHFLYDEKIFGVLWHGRIQKLFNELDLSNIKLHMSLTSWATILEYWHQDVQAGDRQAGNHYAGLWIALDDVDPKSGPFTVIPKSHRWMMDFSIYNERPLSQKKISDYLSEIIKDNKQEPIQFIAKKGQALLWHGHTIHRATPPEDRSVFRKSIIGHYR